MVIEIIRDIEEMAEDESLCEYCDADPGWHSSYTGDMYCCEGAYCEEAYDRYLDDLGVSERAVNIMKSVKVTIERN